MFLRPLSAAVKVVSGLSAWISVHVERQPLASSAAELSLALSTSIFTVPTKVVATALFAAFTEMVARLTDVPAIFVLDRKSTRLNSSHQIISYAVFCLKKKNSDVMSTF